MGGPRWWVGPLLWMAASAGCGGARPCPVRPIGEAEAALQALHAQQAPLRALRAEARVEQRGPSGRIRGRVAMMLRRPASLRFDVMTQFGPAAVLTSDGARFALADLREHRFLEGPTCPENAARLLGIRLPAEQLARLLVGDAPTLPEATEQRMACEDGRYVVRLRAADGRRQRIELQVPEAELRAAPEAQRLRLAKVEVFDAEGKLAWRVELSDHRPVEGVRGPRGPVELPFRVAFEDRRGGQQVRIRLKEVRPAERLPEEAFRQRPRPGMQREEARCDAPAAAATAGEEDGGGEDQGVEERAIEGEGARVERARRLYEAGVRAYRQGDFVTAAERMQRAYEVFPSPALAYNAARVLERMGQYARAADYYRRYLEQGQPSAEERAALQRRIEQLAESERRLREQLITEAPSEQAMTAEARAFYERGVRLFQRGELQAALEAFAAAMQFAPLPEIYFNMGVVAEKLGRRREAADYFEEYLRARPQAPDREPVRRRIEALRRRIEALRGR